MFKPLCPHCFYPLDCPVCMGELRAEYEAQLLAEQDPEPHERWLEDLDTWVDSNPEPPVPTETKP